MPEITFEVCANSLQSALAAQQGGANRIELCAQLEVGGITPSAACIKLSVEQLRIPVFVLIRPGGGDFMYDDYDFCVMKEDIAIAKSLGAAGVVIGMLKPNSAIDVERTAELVMLARPMEVTFHRAFDRTANPFTALEDVIKTGADRLLTSGQKPSAFDGKELLKMLVNQAAARIGILAGAGINPGNVAEIIAYTGVAEVHASCSKKTESNMEFHSQWDTVKPQTVTDVEIVRQITGILKQNIL